MSDAVEPTPHRAARLIEGMSLLPGTQERVLQQLLSRVPIADDPHQQREDDMSMAIVQHPKRFGLACNQRGHQGVIRYGILPRAVGRLREIPTLLRRHDPQSPRFSRCEGRWRLTRLSTVAGPVHASQFHGRFMQCRPVAGRSPWHEQ